VANTNERETRDLLPSAVSLHYTTRGLEENGGRSVTGTRVEDDVEALGAQDRKVRRGGCDEVETRPRCKTLLTGGKGTWKQVGTSQEYGRNWNTLPVM